MLEYLDLSGNGKGVGFVDRAEVVDEFEGTGFGTSARVRGQFNISLSGTFVGKFELQRSYDNGVNWHDLTALGYAIEFTGPCEEVFEENEPSVLYRWACKEYTSGTIIARISQ